jgi:hypothetical protein
LYTYSQMALKYQCILYPHTHRDTNGSQFMMVWISDFSNLWLCKSNTHSVETHLKFWILIFFCLAICGTVFFSNIGWQQQGTVPVRYAIFHRELCC